MSALVYSSSLAAAFLALLIAYTGQSSYRSGWLAAWNHRATGLAADLSVWLGSLPVAIQALALGALGLVVITAVYRSWKLVAIGDR
ncbi:MAG: hypothetical protein ABI959_12910 [Candidatus Dormiibacterota bacterium]